MKFKKIWWGNKNKSLEWGKWDNKFKTDVLYV